jgi:aminoglycoside phosphotransferase
MRFIAQHTSIPVPKVYCAFTHRDRTYIVMERIDGEMVANGWTNRSAESQAKILSQLREMIHEMRNLSPAQGQKIGNVDGGPFFDCRLPGPSLRFGPFSSITDFHRHLRDGFEFSPKNLPEINTLVDLHKGDWPLVFTHGDLSSLNLLVRGEKVVGIVDWETAGWFPAYWEYTTACQVNPHNLFWRKEIDRFLDPQPAELEMEMIRQKYFGDF